MELLLSFISIIAYALGFHVVSGIVGIIATIMFVWFYLKQTKPYMVLLPWSIISIIINFVLVHYKPNFILSVGITSSMSIWITSLIMFLCFKWINR